MSGTDTRFHEDLSILDSFFQAAEQERYEAMPDSWHVAVTDVVNSTEAIRAGRYREVNILGASAIVGILNAAGRISLPYAFGGDGCVICVPDVLAGSARRCLQACTQVAQRQYGLTLRAALVPVWKIREAGFEVRVARYQVSEHYQQALFSGGGVQYAEDRLKDDSSPSELHVTAPEEPVDADFSGLECRWKEVPSARDVTISVLIQSRKPEAASKAIYQAVLNRLQEIFGSQAEAHPLTLRRLGMHWSPGKLSGEMKLRTHEQSVKQKLAFRLQLYLKILIGKVLMALGSRTSETDWSQYKTDMLANADYRKFDDMIRLTLSASREQCEALSAYLEAGYRAGDLVYGIHTSNAAMITCLVFRYQHDHIHFVDATRGGYAEAARALKERSRSAPS